MHGYLDEVPPTLNSLRAVVKANAGIIALRAAAHGCPACILAALRQQPAEYVDSDPQADWTFVFKDEVEKFWATVNEEKASYE
jgi:hypothetical protein